MGSEATLPFPSRCAAFLLRSLLYLISLPHTQIPGQCPLQMPTIPTYDPGSVSR